MSGGKLLASGTSACWRHSPSSRRALIAAVVDGTAPPDLTVTGLAKALPYSWAEQERSRLKTPALGWKVGRLPGKHH